jgi:hypothetical protein
MRVFGIVTALLFIFILSPPPASSQVSLGFQAGLSMAKFGGKDLGGDASYRMGFGGGALLKVPLSDVLSVQPELSFMQKGAEEETSDYDANIKLNYLEIPVLLRFDVPTDGTIDPFFMLGPSMAIKVGCKIGGESGGTSVEVDCDEAGLEVTSVDFGGMLAAGIGIDAGPGQMFVQGRYYAAFTGLDSSDQDADEKNRGWFFSGGYSFPIGG